MTKADKERIVQLYIQWCERSGLKTSQIVARIQSDGVNISRDQFNNRIVRADRLTTVEPELILAIVASFTKGRTENERCTAEEAIEFAELARLPRSQFDELESYFSESEFQEVNDSTSAVPPPREVAALSEPSSPHINLIQIQFWLDALKAWNESIFRWSEAPEYRRSSWAGMVVHGLSILDRISPKVIFHTLVAMGLWILTAWLVAPILHWPESDPDLRLLNAISYAIATLLIPLLVGLFTIPDQIETHHVPTPKKQRELQLLKLIGAYGLFFVSSAPLIMITMIASYIGISLSSHIVRNGLVLFPLLFSHVGARTIPANRLEMYQGEFKLHSADPFFFKVFLFLGPVTAVLIYGVSMLLNDRFLGSSVFLLVGLIISFWEYKKRANDELSDPIAIFFLGFLLPIYVIGVALYSTQPPLSEQESLYSAQRHLSQQKRLDLGIFIIYLLSETILISTLLIRKQIEIKIQGLKGILLFELVIGIIVISNAWLYRTNLWPTVIAVTILVILWQAWGQKRWAHHLRIHPSFWIMQASLGTSIYLVVQEQLIIWAWVNIILYLLIAGALIWWAYQPNSETKSV